MFELPESILRYILEHFAGNRWPAYLLVDHNECVSAWGGHLERYGVATPQAGERVNDVVDFLQGFFPLHDSPTVLSSMETKFGVPVDLHLFSAPDGVWILFLDATAQRDERRRLQQELNDLRLLVGRDKSWGK